MGKNPTIAADNIYCRYRKDAAKTNDKINSREGASELLGCSVSSLSDYELDNTRPPVDMVRRMADLYNAPELMHWYCQNECPIGGCIMPAIEVSEFDRAALKLLAAFSGDEHMEAALLSVASDGKINDYDLPQIKEVLSFLDRAVAAAIELKICVEKQIG